MSTADYKNIIQKFYVAYFGRPADPNGLANIANMLDAAQAPTTTQSFVDAYRTNAAVRSIIDSFGDSGESHDLYVGDTKAFVTAIYSNVLGRAPDTEGLNYWAGAIDNGELSRGSAALTIMAGAESNNTSQGKVDAAMVAAKIVLASQFTDALSTPAALASYAGNAAAAAARTMLFNLSSVSATIGQLGDPVPTVLDLQAADDSGSSSTDNLTRNTSGLTITGQAAGATRVDLFDGATKVGSGTVTNGSFSVDIKLGEAAHTITAVGYTEAGVKSHSSAGLAITVDTTAPADELRISLAEDSGTGDDRISNNASLLLAGLDPNNSVQYSKDGVSWSKTYTPAAGNNIVMARQVDGAGNVGPLSMFTFTYDKTAPTLSSSLPANGAKEMGLSSDIVLTFAEAVTAGSGDIVLNDGGQDVRVIAVSDASQVQVSGKTMTIHPTQPLNPESRYSVLLPAAAVNDVAGNGMPVQSLSFTTVDGTIPTLASSTPSASRVNVSALANLYLNFSESIKAGVGSITISDGAGDRRVISISDSTQVSISGSTVTVNPTLPLKNGAAYDVQMDAGALKDLSGNAFGGVGQGELAFTTASANLSLATLDSSTGFRMTVVPESYTPGSTDYYIFNALATGKSVAGLGDINGDGLDDVMVIAGQALGVYGSTVDYSKSMFVVYGSSDSSRSNFNLAKVDGPTGMRIEFSGAKSGTYIARAAAAGDVNGDGIGDLVIGDFYYGDSSQQSTALLGTAYVAYGASGSRAVFPVNTFNGSNGYQLTTAVAFNYVGKTVAGGDINGDGFSDVIVGAPGSVNQTSPGSTYVLFGSAASAGATRSVADLDGKNGVRIDGEKILDSAGASASASDFNGDGYADIAIGAFAANSSLGSAYVLFGKAGSWSPTLSLGSLTASTGLRITNSLFGPDYGYNLGIEVSSAGDLNGDGYADLLVTANDEGHGKKGISYVIFGHPNDSTGTIDLAKVDGKNGFRIMGHTAGDQAGQGAVAAVGDINGDGYDDLLVGAPGSDAAAADAGSVYVMFGKASGFGAVVDIGTLDAASGWRIDGAKAGDKAGTSVSAAGDVNGDGFDDIIIGAPDADKGAGAAYIVYGRDVTGSVRFLGVSDNDLMIGTAAAENFVGGLGDDLMIGGGGADAFHGGAGNDTIVLANTLARNIDGGSGTDTLRLAGANQTLDLALFRNRIEGIEIIDLTGTGNNTLKVLARDLLNMNETSNALQVDGNAGDKVVLGSGWTDGGIVGDYHHYVQGNAVILVGVALSVTL